MSGRTPLPSFTAFFSGGRTRSPVSTSPRGEWNTITNRWFGESALTLVVLREKREHLLFAFRMGHYGWLWWGYLNHAIMPATVKEAFMAGLWRVDRNDGDIADLLCGAEQKQVHRPSTMDQKQFLQYLKPGSSIADISLAIWFPE
jgi:hypothetical protein